MKSGAGKGKLIAILALGLILLLTVFYVLANRRQPTDLTVLTATQATVQRDLESYYPQTPKAVVKYYAELTQCMYDPSNTDKEISELAKQSRLLFDEELRATQTDEDYLNSLHMTINTFRNESRKIISFTTSNSAEVEYRDTANGKLSSLFCVYTMQKDGVNYTDTEQFLLRKDEKGRWKILGWQSPTAMAPAEQEPQAQ